MVPKDRVNQGSQNEAWSRNSQFWEEHTERSEIRRRQEEQILARGDQDTEAEGWTVGIGASPKVKENPLGVTLIWGRQRTCVSYVQFASSF